MQINKLTFDFILFYSEIQNLQQQLKVLTNKVS